MLVQQLRKRWRARETSTRLHDALCFQDNALVLGAGTVMAKADHSCWSAEAGIRLKALLSAAYQEPIPSEALGHIKAAMDQWSKGDQPRAMLHLALCRLGRLATPHEAARRLFMADGLMRAGVRPETLLEALDFEAPLGAKALKYSPTELRIPAGNGRPSGRWTAGSGGGSGAPAASANPSSRSAPRRPARSTSQATAPQLAQHSIPLGARRTVSNPSRNLLISATAAGRAEGALDLGEMPAGALEGLVAFVTRLVGSGVVTTATAAGGATAALGVLFIPSTGPRGRWVDVGGPGNLNYYHNPDQLSYRFKYTTASGKPGDLVAFPDPNGDFRDPEGRVFGRLVKAGVKVGVVISTAALVGGDNEEPKLCPARVKDNGGERGTAYEDYAKVRLNPQNPTPHGIAYAFVDPATDKVVKIDDCQQTTRNPYEYKWINFEKHLLKGNFIWGNMKANMLKQSMTQLRASQGRPLTWVFAEKNVAVEVGQLFHKTDHGRESIDIAVWPWSGKPTK